MKSTKDGYYEFKYLSQLTYSIQHCSEISGSALYEVIIGFVFVNSSLAIVHYCKEQCSQ